MNCSPDSSTLYTSFADGGRCPIFPVSLFPLVFTTKTIPHSGSPVPDRNSQLLSISQSVIPLFKRQWNERIWRMRQKPPSNQFLNKTRSHHRMATTQAPEQMPMWRRGYAADCRSAYPGSIPGIGSRLGFKRISGKEELRTGSLNFFKTFKLRLWRNHSEQFTLSGAFCPRHRDTPLWG